MKSKENNSCMPGEDGSTRFWSPVLYCLLPFFLSTIIVPAMASERFIDSMYDVHVDENIVFATGSIGNPPNGEIPLALDLYTPIGAEFRSPGMILLYGGGFEERHVDQMKPLAEDFASRGWSVATADYRILLDDPTLEEGPFGTPFALQAAMHAAINDAAKALDWMKDNASQLNIDSDRIVLGGASSGAIASLFEGYRNDSAAAIVSYAGGLYGYESLIINAGDPPVVLIHGTADTVVPYHMSEDIVARAESVGVPVALMSIEGAGHENFFAEPAYMATTFAFVSDFLYENLDLATLAETPAPRLQIVVPTGLEHVEGDTISIASEGMEFRTQLTYAGTEFHNLPDTHRLITGIAFRPDASVNEAQTVAWDDTQWYLSTSTTDAADRSTAFSANHGPDRTLVYDGPLTLTTEAKGPPGGPRAFDYSFDLQVPFPYDAGDGNLVIDIAAPSGYAPALRDDQSVAQGQTGALISPSVSDENGFFHSSQLILQLTFAPERSVAFDFNADGNVGIADVDMLVGEIARGNNSDWFDLTSDSVVDDADLTQWRSDAADHNGFSEAYLPGDTNLDGTVNAADLNQLALNWRREIALWSAGDFTADGHVDAGDLNELGVNWNRSIPLTAANTAVPEPAALLLAFIAAGLVARRCWFP